MFQNISLPLGTLNSFAKLSEYYILKFIIAEEKCVCKVTEIYNFVLLRAF